MGMRSTGGLSINRRWHSFWGRITGGINGYIETGSFKSGASSAGQGIKGTVTVKPKARKVEGAKKLTAKTLEGGAKVQIRGNKTVVTGTRSAPQVNIQAKIAAGKAAAGQKPSQPK